MYSLVQTQARIERYSAPLTWLVLVRKDKDKEEGVKAVKEGRDGKIYFHKKGATQMEGGSYEQSWWVVSDGVAKGPNRRKGAGKNRCFTQSGKVWHYRRQVKTARHWVSNLCVVDSGTWLVREMSK